MRPLLLLSRLIAIHITDAVDLHFISEGMMTFLYGLNSATVWGSAVSFASEIRGRAPQTLDLMKFIKDKIQHLINIAAPKLAGRKYAQCIDSGLLNVCGSILGASNF